jgi:hypothetical protein
MNSELSKGVDTTPSRNWALILRPVRGWTGVDTERSTRRARDVARVE